MRRPNYATTKNISDILDEWQAVDSLCQKSKTFQIKNPILGCASLRQSFGVLAHSLEAEGLKGG